MRTTDEGRQKAETKTSKELKSVSREAGSNAPLGFHSHKQQSIAVFGLSIGLSDAGSRMWRPPSDHLAIAMLTC